MNDFSEIKNISTKINKMSFPPCVGFKGLSNLCKSAFDLEDGHKKNIKEVAKRREIVEDIKEIKASRDLDFREVKA